MIHRLHGVTIYIAAKVVDLRKGHDGLAASVQSHLRKKPFDGAVHVFRAKWADRLKLIYWDGTGLVPLMAVMRKRLPGSAWLTNAWNNTRSNGPTVRQPFACKRREGQFATVF